MKHGKKLHRIPKVTFVLFQYFQGDSGGPLIKVKEDGKKEVIGIVSWGIIPCGTTGAPSVYTKVSSYNQWIHDIMANN